MYTTMMAASFWFHPASSTPTGVNRMRAAVFFTALGAIVGWPFAAAIGIPIIFEQLTSFGGEIIPQNERAGWHKRRVVRLTMAIAGSALIAVSLRQEPHETKPRIL
jgi:alpha-1,2-mannosyltransferase